MKQSITLFLGILLCASAHTQSISLPGEVVIHNSEYETGAKIHVGDASIRAPYAKAVVSDKDGQFVLAFAGVENGTPVRITVEKPGLEVVNTRELEQQVLGRIGRVRIVMAKHDKLEEAKARFYKVATTSIRQTYDRRMHALRDTTISLEQRLTAARAEMNDSLADMGKVIMALSTQLDQAMGQAEELARTFATVDLDAASAQYRRACELFSQGDVEGALELIGPERLEADMRAALSQKRSGTALIADANKEIRQVVQSYGLRADVLAARLQFRDRSRALGTMIQLAQENVDVFEVGERCDMMVDLGNVYTELAMFTQADSILRSALHIMTASGAGTHLVTAQAWDKLGTNELRTGRYDSCLAISERAGTIYAAVLGEEHPRIAMTLQLQALALLDLGRIEDALALNSRAYTMLLHHPETTKAQLASLMHSRGSILFEQGSYDQALIQLDSALTLYRTQLNADDARISAVLKTISTIEGRWGDPELADRYQREALVMRERIYGREHPTTASALNDLGLDLMHRNQLDSAELLIRQALEIEQRLLGPRHDKIAHSLGGLGAVLLRKKDPDGAWLLAHQSLVMFKELHGMYHYTIPPPFLVLGQIDRERKRYDASLAYLDSASWVASKVFEKHPIMGVICNYRGGTYKDMGRLEDALSAYGRADSIYTVIFGEMGVDRELALRRQAEVLELIGRYAEARSALLTGQAILRTAKGGTTPEAFDGLLALGRVNYALGLPDSALYYLDRADSIRVKSDSPWFRYKIALDQENTAAAMDYLLQCARTRSKAPIFKQKEETLAALKELATKLGRQDVLKEFDLE